MIGLDTNIIVHYLVTSQREHARVRRWFSVLSSSPATTQTNIGEVLRLLTHPKVFPTPLRLAEAVPLLADFVEAFDVRILEEAPDWWKDLLEIQKMHPSLKGNEIFDARIALCLRYNGVKEFCTMDASFAKYPFLRMIPIE